MFEFYGKLKIEQKCKIWGFFWSKHFEIFQIISNLADNYQQLSSFHIQKKIFCDIHVVFIIF